MNANDQFLGIVQNGEFRFLTPEPTTSVKLTSMPMQAAQVPRELDLSGYEGKAIVVHGHNTGEWIYSASVIDQAGPILTSAVQQVLMKTCHPGPNYTSRPSHIANPSNLSQ